MIAFPFVYRLPLAVAVCLISVEGSLLHAQDAGLPESIRLALVRSADLAPLAVAWTQTTEATSTGREKIAADGCVVQQLAFRDGRIYQRRETKGDSAWPPRTDETTFDRNLLYAARNLFYAGNPGKRDPKDRPYLHKWLPKNDDPQASYFRDDYFRAAGIRLPRRIKELVQSWHPQSELLALLAEGGQVQSVSSINVDGHPLFRVEVVAGKLQDPFAPSQRYDFYFDPERGYAVRRLEIRDGVGRLMTRCECTDFEQLSGRQVWMPRRCRVEAYASPSPSHVTRIQVNVLDVQPWPDDRFQLAYTTPGIYVNDASFSETTRKDGIFYQIPANPQRLDEVIAVRRALHQAWMNAEKKTRPLRVLFLVLNGVGLAGLAVYLFMRRRKKASCT